MANICSNFIIVEGLDSDVELFLEKFNEEIEWLDSLVINKEHSSVGFNTAWGPKIEEVKEMAKGGTLFIDYFYEELGSDVYGVTLIKPEGEIEEIDLSTEEIRRFTDMEDDDKYEQMEDYLRSKIKE